MDDDDDDGKEEEEDDGIIRLDDDDDEALNNKLQIEKAYNSVPVNFPPPEVTTNGVQQSNILVPPASSAVSAAVTSTSDSVSALSPSALVPASVSAPVNDNSLLNTLNSQADTTLVAPSQLSKLSSSNNNNSNSNNDSISSKSSSNTDKRQCNRKSKQKLNWKPTKNNCKIRNFSAKRSAENMSDAESVQSSSSSHSARKPKRGRKLAAV